MADQRLFKLGDTCRAFKAADLVQNFTPEKMIGNWFPLYSLKNPITDWASKLQECPAVVLEKWDLDSVKDKLLAKRFPIENYEGFYLNYGYNMSGTKLPIKVKLRGWQDKNSVESSIWTMPIPSPMLTEGYHNAMVLATDYTNFALLYHCHDRPINKINLKKGESIYIYARQNAIDKLPKEASDKLEAAFDKLFDKQGELPELKWANLDKDFLKENHDSCTEYPYIGKVEEKKEDENK